MSIRRLEDLVAFQFAGEFKDAVYALLDASPRARKDFRFVAQVRDATDSVASNIAEGFQRFLPADGANFLRYALGSLAETKERLEDGIRRGYYSRDSCALALMWERRCRNTTLAFRKSLLRNAERDRQARRPQNKSEPPPPRPPSHKLRDSQPDSPARRRPRSADPNGDRGHDDSI